MHITVSIIPAALLAQIAHGLFLPLANSTKSCESSKEGFHCHREISRTWGAYTPYYSVAPDYKDPKIDGECTVTFASVLSRHAARYPTKSIGDKMKATIDKIKASAKSYSAKTTFIKNFNYDLAPNYEQLTEFGKQEMHNSGIKFFHRYSHLTKTDDPFIRVSGQQRVIDSGAFFTAGYLEEKTKANKSPAKPLPPPVVVTEGKTFNNTLDHGTCREFESGRFSKTNKDPLVQYKAIFTPPIVKRLNADLPGASLTSDDAINLMTLCPFYTVINGFTLSEFCTLFAADEFKQFNYYQTLSKYYRYADGNPLGPTQGVGYVNELIGRLTKSEVKDATSTNKTVIGPVDRKLYADFSHDNTMVSVFAALQLFKGVPTLSTQRIEATDKFNLADLVPFASRMYVEKLQCKGQKDELVRVLINDRVMKLQCPEKKYGGCSVTDFVNGLEFARKGGNWDQCGK
ncbi:hypothetical protein TWF696_005460 [Orbilia brochopaga]|uniref:Phytase A n=1 Tax=Orbilia brochopaga TaxID=3140254 RepID=A0AAV9V0U8_9PEZI